MKKIIPIFILLLAGISALARAIVPWTEAELQKASQLVMIGTVTNVRDLDEVNTVLWPGRTKLLGVEATFAVSKVLKGDFTNRTVVLHYYRWDTPFKTSDIGSAIGPDPNSPGLIYLTPNNTNQFLLYLVSDGASRYAPASGQIDLAGYAVREFHLQALVTEAVSHEFHLQAYLATLHTGMTAQDAQRELDRCGCITFSTVSSVVSHRAYYLCFDGSSITLQYDAHDKLMSWKGEKGQNVPPNTALEPTATAP
jgi:hypothetical protein